MSVDVPNIASVPSDLDWTKGSESRKKRIKLLAESVYKPKNRRERLIARSIVRKSLKGIRI